jgi:hypothetical protein
MMRLALTCLIDPCIRIITRSSEISDVPEQMPLRILHPQIPKLFPNFEKHLRCISPGPALDRQPSDQNKPTPPEHLIEYSLQSRCEGWKLTVLRVDSALNFPNLRIGQALFPIIALRKI